MLTAPPGGATHPACPPRAAVPAPWCWPPRQGAPLTLLVLHVLPFQRLWCWPPRQGAPLTLLVLHVLPFQRRDADRPARGRHSPCLSSTCCRSSAVMLTAPPGGATHPACPPRAAVPAPVMLTARQGAPLTLLVLHVLPFQRRDADRPARGRHSPCLSSTCCRSSAVMLTAPPGGATHPACPPRAAVPAPWCWPPRQGAPLTLLVLHVLPFQRRDANCPARGRHSPCLSSTCCRSSAVMLTAPPGGATHPACPPRAAVPAPWC